MTFRDKNNNLPYIEYVHPIVINVQTATKASIR